VEEVSIIAKLIKLTHQDSVGFC